LLIISLFIIHVIISHSVSVTLNCYLSRSLYHMFALNARKNTVLMMLTQIYSLNPI